MMTLRLKLPVGQTLFLTLIWIILAGIVIELPARSSLAGEFLPAQGLGSAHRQFEIQSDRLIKRAEAAGGIDCLFIGNSHILRAIDPAAIEAQYKEKTGQSIRCQNFGLRGASVQLTGQLAAILSEKYHPKLIVLGLAMLDMDQSLAGKGDKNILKSPWMEYQSGKFSPEGFLIDHSYGYRYYLGFNNTYFSTVQLTDADGAAFDGNIQANGFNPSPNIFRPEELTAAAIEKIRATYESIQMDDGTLQGLDQILALSRTGVEILVVEMPVAPFVLELSPLIRENHARYIETLTAKTTEYNKIFWQTQGLALIPADGWSDHNHLNGAGADLFSRWLGDQIAQAVLNGTLNLFNGSTP
jgi:hypothetical protein